MRMLTNILCAASVLIGLASHVARPTGSRPKGLWPRVDQ